MDCKPLDLITSIRDSFIGAEQVYMNGSCVMFYRILHTVYPDARPYWSVEARHCVTKIENKYYDITGEVKIDKSYKLDEKVYATFYISSAMPKERLERKRYAVAKKLF